MAEDDRLIIQPSSSGHLSMLFIPSRFKSICSSLIYFSPLQRQDGRQGSVKAGPDILQSNFSLFFMDLDSFLRNRYE
jgi:hypothetical protein